MNKTVLTVAILALAVSLVNTVLLVQLIGHLKGIGDKIEPVAKEFDKIQKILERPRSLLPELPKIKPFKAPVPKEKRQSSTNADLEPIVLPKQPAPPLPKP